MNLKAVAAATLVIGTLAGATNAAHSSASPNDPSARTAKSKPDRASGKKAPTKKPAVRVKSVAAPTLYSGTVLFIDSHRIGATSNVHRDYVAGTKAQLPGLPAGQVDLKPVTRYLGESPESDAADGDTDVDSRYLLAAQTVMQETDPEGRPLYRMWVRSGAHIGYRESSDGVHWHPRDADSVIVVKDVVSASVVKDSTSGLYYLLGWSRNDAGYVEFVSTDGVNFKPTEVFAGMLSELFGDVVQAANDPVTGTLYASAKQRTDNGALCGSERLRGGGRTFGTHASNSARPGQKRLARVWAQAPVVTFSADCVDARSVPELPGTVRPAHMYGIPFQRYGDQFIGFPWFFQVTALPPSADLTGFTDGPVDTQIASTPDVMRTPWRRSDPVVTTGSRRQRPALIARGAAGEWDDGMIYGQTGLVTLEGRSALYYSGWNGTHMPAPGRNARVGLATWRKDSFVGLKVTNPARRGLVRTTAFRVPAGGSGRTVHVNADLRPGATLRAAVIDARTNRPVAGFGMAESTVVSGDTVDAEITWRGRDLGALGPRPVRIQFSFGSGSLYSFKVA